jgi:hypothetical protein
MSTHMRRQLIDAGAVGRHYYGSRGNEDTHGNNAGYFPVYFSIISFMTSAAVLLPFRISCIISVDGGRM